MLTVDEFTPYLRSELLKAGLDVGKFDRSLFKARKEADDLTKKLEDQNKESFRLLREYLHAEEAETKEMEKFIDRLQKGDTLLSLEDTPYANFVSDTPNISESALTRFTKYQNTRLTSSVEVRPDPLEQSLTSIQKRMNRLIAATSSSSNASPPTAAGYSPSFDGIYILTPVSKTQTRLFDYTSILQ